MLIRYHPSSSTGGRAAEPTQSSLGEAHGPRLLTGRRIEQGGQNLSVAIARVLDMTPSEAEPIKHSVSLLEPAEAAAEQIQAKLTLGDPSWFEAPAARSP